MKPIFANIVLKVLYVFVAVYSLILLQDLSGFRYDGIAARLYTYTFDIFLVFIIWRLSSSVRGFFKNEYPHFIDACVTFAVGFDLFGNAVDLYDTVWWWDDMVHLVSIVPWALICGYALKNVALPRFIRAFSVVGFGILSGVLWEILEYFLSTRSGRIEGVTGYPDTIGDLIMTLVGSSIAAIITLKLLAKPKK